MLGARGGPRSEVPTRELFGQAKLNKNRFESPQAQESRLPSSYQICSTEASRTLKKREGGEPSIGEALQ